MLTNFTFDGNVGTRYEGKHYDLHSFFSVRRLVVTPSDGTVLMEFRSIAEFRDQAHSARKLTLTFSDIEYLEFSPKFCTNTTDSFEEFGFKSPDDKDDT